MTTIQRKRRRNTQKLIVAIDIGTTYSGASFQILAQGHDGPIQEVNKWPKQAVDGAKIPSTIFYDSDGQPKMFGAETEDEDAICLAESDGWNRAEWWKLAMCPDHLLQKDVDIPISMPDRVEIDQIFKDQLGYIKRNVETFISDSYSESADLWNDDSTIVEIILTTPNGWSGMQQQRIRKAAVAAGLVAPQGGNRVKFVSEGEAALHFCMATPTLKDSIKLGDTVVVCDAGGGTIDIGTYLIKDLSPLRVEEVCGSQCLIGGGSLVTKVARDAIQAHLQGSRWDNPMCIATAIKGFEDRLKRTFTGEEPGSKRLLFLGGLHHDDKRYDIVRGRLMLLDEEIKEFFAPSLKVIIGGLECAIADNPPEIIFLVGGLADSKYVLTYLQSWAKERNIRIAKPDGSMAKAIANGALHRYQHSAVDVHISGMHYGTETDVLFDSEAMPGRTPFLNILGEWRVRASYYPIVNKDERLRMGAVKKADFHRHFGDGDNLNVEMDLVGYRGDQPPDFYMKPDLRTMVEGFTNLGVVKANLKAVFDPLPWETRPTSSKRFKKLTYQICLTFDEIELRAFLKWRVNHRTMMSDAAVIFF